MLRSPHRFALRRPPGPEVYRARQVHGASVVRVSGSEPFERIAEHPADAVVTHVAGVAVGVRTADCVPILIEDPTSGGVAAVHGGWRGLVAGVIEAAVVELGGRPAEMRAALGASIGPCCFEVGPEVADAFDGFIVTHAGREKPHVDLQSAARRALRRAGVDAIDPRPVPCTRCDPVGYFSYRRMGPGCPQHFHVITAPAGEAC